MKNIRTVRLRLLPSGAQESREDSTYVKAKIKINADLNAARNIAKKAGYNTPTPKKILSYIVATNGVKPLTPQRRGNNQDPHSENPTHQGGEGVIFKANGWWFSL